ncbi:aminoglycoside phosphotransferase family protein [Streptomyces aidingensis]|uniref:Phosphotransferase enzyme family protein n=1 Tax=Streptomyces aidingensis TaxID=910347 RepID=A0A1I1KLU8_9ACTN|nr:aminoglycoside phosphotransferase family protein [Streptomyces aidingensis]SFC61555.1 Phosphotransferase enzyme family protein [Streptomyces aidingensis]
MKQERAAARLACGAEKYGPFGPAAVKPLSVTRRTLDGTALLKVYRGIEPLGRRDREVAALGMARRMGLRTPAVHGTGEDGEAAWAVTDIVPGAPCSVDTTRDMEIFIELAAAVGAALHGSVAGLVPGAGWQATGPASHTHRDFLLEQLSVSCRRQPWWEELASMLAPLDDDSTVYLHGDIKPEHLLVDGKAVHVVDWEASARGPAACDHADTMFHLVRDLAYAGVGPQRMPLDLIGQVPVAGPVIAWRVVRWLDRRRQGDIGLLTQRDLRSLAETSTPAEAAHALARLITALRADGVPR